jgi:hypothetical protein
VCARRHPRRRARPSRHRHVLPVTANGASGLRRVAVHVRHICQRTTPRILEREPTYSLVDQPCMPGNRWTSPTMPPTWSRPGRRLKSRELTLGNYDYAYFNSLERNVMDLSNRY